MKNETEVTDTQKRAFVDMIKRQGHSIHERNFEKLRKEYINKTLKDNPEIKAMMAEYKRLDSALLDYNKQMNEIRKKLEKVEKNMINKYNIYPYRVNSTYDLKISNTILDEFWKKVSTTNIEAKIWLAKTREEIKSILMEIGIII